MAWQEVGTCSRMQVPGLGKADDRFWVSMFNELAKQTWTKLRAQVGQSCIFSKRSKVWHDIVASLREKSSSSQRWCYTCIPIHMVHEKAVANKPGQQCSVDASLVSDQVLGMPEVRELSIPRFSRS